jgi:thiol:disulfide interchange protein DsbC
MKTFLLSLVLLMFALPAAADDGSVAETIRERVAEIAPQAEVGDIEPTPLEGIWSVVVGGDVVFMSADGRYLFHGELVDLQAQRSLTEEKRQAIRLNALEELGESSMIIYEPEGESRYEITVATDIDCPYCRQMHRQIEEYTALGIRVRYLLMPRAGVQSDSYDKAVSVWCADDRHAALTRAKLGQPIDRLRCDNPVDEHMALTQQLGVRATPTIITGSGSMIPGYRPPQALADLLARDAQGLAVR